MNIVSQCCQKPIVTGAMNEFPLGGNKWGINYKVNICEGCGHKTDEMEVCGTCGNVDCLGGCLDV